MGTLIDRDLARLRPAARGYLVIASLELVALAHYPDIPDWGSARTLWSVGFLLSMYVVGITALVGGHSPASTGAHRPRRYAGSRLAAPTALPRRDRFARM